MKVKAVERKLKFTENGPEEYRFVLSADLYGKLSETKVIKEASLRSGISKGAINAAWDAIGEVIKAWATEGHSVAIPGLGSMRFGLRSKSVKKVEDVGTNLITSRRVIFVPNTDIKQELAKTSINITCYDRNGNVVKQVTSGDSGDVEDPDNEPTPTPTGGGTSTGGSTSTGGNTSGGGSTSTGGNTSGGSSSDDDDEEIIHE